MREHTWCSVLLAVAVLLATACATAPPKTTTVDQLAGTTWAGEWGSDSAHGMRSQVRLKITQADLGAIKGTMTLAAQGRDHSFPASGVMETRDGATWLRVTVEGNRTFDLRFTGNTLEGRGKSAIHEGPVTLRLE